MKYIKRREIARKGARGSEKERKKRNVVLHTFSVLPRQSIYIAWSCTNILFAYYYDIYDLVINIYPQKFLRKQDVEPTGLK